MIDVIVLLAQGFEEVEALCPVDYSKRAGLSVLTLAVGERQKDDLEVIASHKTKIIADMTLKEFIKKNETARAVVIPGGMPGAINISKDKDACSLIQAVAKSTIVAAICAAPVVVLAKLGLLLNKQYTCYPDMQNDYAKDFLQGHRTDAVVKDGNLITAKGVGAAPDFAIKIVDALCGSQKAKEVAKNACMPCAL